MKIFFVGDLHIGAKTLKSAHAAKIAGREILSTKDAALLTLSRAIEDFFSNKSPDETAVAIFAGDVIDGPQGVSNLENFYDILRESVSEGIFSKVYIFPGNHDYDENKKLLLREPEDEFFEFLKEPRIKRGLLHEEPFIAFFFPFNPTVAYSSTSGSPFAENPLDQLFAETLKDALTEKEEEGLPLILFSHGGIKEVMRAAKKEEKEYDFLNLSILKEKIDFSFLGHIHTPPANLEAYNIFYSGILEPIKVDHVNTGYIMIEIETDHSSSHDSKVHVNVRRKNIAPTVKLTKINDTPSRIVKRVEDYFASREANTSPEKSLTMEQPSEITFFTLDSDEQREIKEKILKLIESKKHLLPLEGRMPTVRALPEGVGEKLREDFEDIMKTLESLLEKESFEVIKELSDDMKWVIFFSKKPDEIKKLT